MLILLFLWCFGRAVWLFNQLESLVRQGGGISWVRTLEDVTIVRAQFLGVCTTAAVLCGIGFVGWLLIKKSAPFQRFLPLIGAVLFFELLWSARGRSVQSDPALYYPVIPVLEELSRAEPGRVIGESCFPATLSVMCDLRDIRGYDGIDPARMVELLMQTATPTTFLAPHAFTQYLVPKTEMPPGTGVRLAPILDMLNVRYVIRRGSPPRGTVPAFQGMDYYVLENPAALPRTYVPRQVKVVSNPQERLRLLASDQFDPRQVAFTEVPVELPDACEGNVELEEHAPTRISVKARMQTAGLVVLADRWDKGWQARLDGKRVPILRVNHALGGVVVPAGTSLLMFEYSPASFRLGLYLSGIGAVLLAAWLVSVRIWRNSGNGALGSPL
jgi:hypothetical protein